MPIVRALLEQGAAVNAKDRWGGTPLRDAVRQGRLEVAAELRSKGGILGYDEVAASGELCELAKRGSLDLLQLLLQCGCEANAADYDGRRPLHLAASEGNKQIVELLLREGANRETLDRWGNTALDDAVRQKHAHVEAVLQASSA